MPTLRLSRVANYDVVVVKLPSGDSVAYNRNGDEICRNSATSCIQEAINYAVSNGLREVVLRGTFNIAEPIVINGVSNLKIKGGKIIGPTRQKIVDGTLIQNMIFVNNSSNITIEDMVIDYNGASVTPDYSIRAAYDMVRIDNSNRIIVRNLELMGAWGAALSLHYDTRVKVDGIYAHDLMGNSTTPTDCIHVGNSTYVTITSSKCEDFTDVGTAIDNSENVLVEGVQYVSESAVAAVAITNWSSDTNHALRISISGINVRIWNASKGGIWIDTTVNSTNVDTVNISSSLIFVENGYTISIYRGKGSINHVTIMSCELAWSTNDKAVFGAASGIDLFMEDITFVNYLYAPIPPIDIFDGLGRHLYCANGYCNYSFRRGVAVFSGDGTTTQFTIPHGLYTAPRIVSVTPGSSLPQFYVSVDNTNIYVNFASAPPSGTDNIKLYWYAEV
jgi:hypothetical protein